VDTHRDRDDRLDLVAGVLGGVEIRLSGRLVPVGHARQKAVLAVLLVEANRVIPTDSLVDRVWGDHAPAQARSVLYTYLSHLRRALAPAGVTINRQDAGYLLTIVPDVVDVHRFRRVLDQAREQQDPHHAVALAQEALALWRGEPLAELDTPWAQAVRERLRQEHVAAEADRIDWALECGSHQELLPELTARAAEHPLDERIAAQLMLALYRSGRQADALRHYQHTRHQLAEELGADPTPALRDLHQRILTADPALTLTVTGPAAAEESRPAVTPRQLPAAPAQFVGRREELARLDAILSSIADPAATVVISAISGAGGIGKTWLALHWTHRHAGRFPDGQLFVDLRGFSPAGRPADPVDVLGGFLEALGVDRDRQPTDPDRRAEMYRSVVADKRMLVVLDNAATTDQVTPLLPGGHHCTVVVTSRNHLRGLIARHGARPVHLDVLTGTEAHTLLATALGAERTAGDAQAVAELIELCGRLPLALGLIAARAVADLHLPLQDVVAELRALGLDALDSEDPTASLPTVLSWSLRHLTDQQRQAFALLGIAPGPDTGLPAATHLIGLPEREAHAMLRALADASLIDRAPGGRYAMHDLVRAYATTIADNLPDDVRQTALRRVLDFYTHTAHTADRLLHPHRDPAQLDPPANGVHPNPLPDTPKALAWFDTEHACLLAAQHTATTHHWHPTAWHLAWALDTFHYRRGHRHDRLTAWQAATDAATHLPDPTTRTLAHRYVGYAHADLGHHQDALDHLHQALTLAQHHHDSTHQALTHRALGRAWELRGDDRQALNHARRALDLYRDLHQPVWEARTLNAVGWFAARLGDYDTAREHCQAALTLHRHHHDPEGETSTLDSLGYIDHHSGHHTQAINHYHHALTVRRDLGHTYQVADTLDRLGHPHAALGQTEQARTVWRQALQLYRQQGRHDDAHRVQQQLDALDQPDATSNPTSPLNKTREG
jgi:DNA-binding SARP family transcriptional activator/tetratricopeptide (TPR) repeat protein